MRLDRQRRAVGLVVGLLLAMLVLGAGGRRVEAQAAGVGANVASGWNLIAAPPGTDLSGAQALYTLQAGDTGYETLDLSQATVAGYGYWAYFGDSATMNLGAGSSDPYTVNAPASQYIMIGDPSGTSSADVSGADIVYTYDAVNGYTAATTLNPGQGAWAFSYNGGTITVTPTGTIVAANTPPPGAQPPSARFYGAVTTSGQPAASGVAIVATAADGATCGNSTVGAAPASGSNYSLDSTGSDPGCTTSGATITLSVGGATAGSGAIPDVSGPVHVDLSTP